MSTDIVSQAIVQLFDQERFYAELVMQMDRIISHRVPTAGVCVKSRIQLHINPTFFESLTQAERVAVLKHECQHILNDHIGRSKEMRPEIYAKNKSIEDSIINVAKHQVMNIAADLSINPSIPNLPSIVVQPGQFDLASGETMEWYVGKLKDHDKLKDLTHYDGHSLWAESEGASEEVKEKIRAAVNAAAKKAKDAGNLSHEASILVDRFNYKARDWKSDLKRFAARAMETALSSSKKKRNRRYGIMYPGVVKEELLHIGVAIDTSGSISDEALCQFMAEIANIAKYATVTVVEADCEVKNSYVFDPRKKYEVSGRGGTAYQPAFDYFTNDTDVDGVIYLGDMDCFDEVLTKPKYPVMWAVLGSKKPPAEWGTVTKVEVVNK